MARSLPATIRPDHLTIIGVLGSLTAAAALIASHVSLTCLWVGVFGLFVNWLGDSLDGTLARVRSIERTRYGFFVDHLSDLASQFLIVLGLGLSPFMRFDVAALALLGYLTLSIYSLVKLHVARVMKITYFGVGPTEIRVLIGAGMVLAALVNIPHVDTPLGSMSVYDGVALVVFAFAMVSAVVMFIRDARLLAVIDPPRYAPPPEVSMVEVRSERLTGGKLKVVKVIALRRGRPRIQNFSRVLHGMGSHGDAHSRAEADCCQRGAENMLTGLARSPTSGWRE